MAAACAEKPLPLADVQQLKAADGSYGQDIYGKRRAAGEPVPVMRGNQLLEIRSYTVKEGDFGTEVRDKEIAGAECLVQAEDASATVRTPGAMHIPLYGYRTPAISIACRKDGFANAIVPVRTYNVTQSDRAAVGAQGGLIGVLVTAAINAASDETNDVYNYVAPDIRMRPGTATDLPVATSSQEAGEETAAPSS